MGVRVAIPNFARGCPFTCSFCSQWKFWRDYRVRDPKKVVDEIETLVRDHEVGFFILADEEPTIHRKKFIAFCEELIERNLPRAVGHQHPRHRHPARREAAADVPQGRADPRVARHRGGGAAEARPLQQGNHDRAEQEGDPAAARRRHRHRGAVHRRPRERDRRDAGRDLPDGARLEPRHGQLGDVHALAVLATCSRSWATRSRCSTSRSTTSSRRS